VLARLRADGADAALLCALARFDPSATKP